MIRRLQIKGIPAVLYGSSSAGVYLYIHGQHSSKEAAESFACVACRNGWQVLSIDLPEHGERKSEECGFFAWDIIPELKQLLGYAKEHWDIISLRAHSIGAYFSMLSYKSESMHNAQFVSPIINMQQLYLDLMQQSNISVTQLQNERIIPAILGQTLYWDEYRFATEHPTSVWAQPTDIIFGEKDNLTNLDDITAFSTSNHCRLTVVENGEHWFHTEDQLTALNKWTLAVTPKL